MGRLPAAWLLLLPLLVSACAPAARTGAAPRRDGIMPAAPELKADRPRLLLRPEPTPCAVSLAELRAIPRDAEFDAMLGRLRAEKSAACQALAWRLTGDRAAAEAALARMRGFKPPEKPDSFDVFFRLRELALAYDWLGGYEGFGADVRAGVRAAVRPLVEAGLRIGDDHLFHNYVWQANGGLSLWALATAGEDAEGDRLYATVRERLDRRLFPGMAHLAGAPGESMWYWALYDFSPAALAVLAAESASEQPLARRIREEHDDWLAAQLRHLIGSTAPDLSYAPFGDTKSGGKDRTAGPDGGVTHEMAGVLCGLSRLLGSGEGVWFDGWIASKRGTGRFYGETAIYYFLYARTTRPKPVEPPLAVFAGAPHGGHLVARSGWGDDATVVAFRCTDHYGDHNHFDQGSFQVWRRRWLALDPCLYKKVAGPQQATEHHNTLLVGGRGQRKVRGQDSRTIAAFKAELESGRRLETGDVLFHREAPGYAAAAGQFAQAYPEGTLRSCVRQLLFVRPSTVVVVDRLEAPAGAELGEVRWLLHVPRGAKVEPGAATVADTKAGSWLRCRRILPSAGAAGVGAPELSASLEPGYERLSFAARGAGTLTLAHVVEVGDGEPGAAPVAEVRVESDDADGLVLSVGARRWRFAASGDFAVEPVPAR